MKKFTTLLAAFLCFAIIHAKPIDKNKAELVAKNFTSYRLKKSVKASQFTAVSIQLNAASNTNASTSNNPAVFAVNIGNNDGFVIVSGDDAALPILGYADNGRFSTQNMPRVVVKWFNQYDEQIRYIRSNKIEASARAEKLWNQYSTEASVTTDQYFDASVAPLVKADWNQGNYYNASCPYDASANERTVTGCVATAMAIIMKYHAYPVQGKGFHSYNHSKYGTLSANFGNTTYNWSSMPNKVSSSNSSVATLMKHCGVSVDMNYGVGSTGGSGAYVITNKSPVTHCSEYAFKQYFDYKSTTTGIERVNYTTASWKLKLKSELDASRPILYAGFGGGGGHAFVCDGYDANDLFHFNWGWGGAYNGYFSVDALNPSGVGTGGGTGGFNSGHQAVVGIEPKSTGGGGGGGGGTTDADMVMYTDISPSSLTIGYGAQITVSANVYNKGTTDFSGSYAAAIFDSDGVFVDFVETKDNQSLAAGYVYTNPLSFTNTGLLSVLPGKYIIGIYYKSGTGNWKVVADNNGNSNWINMDVVNNNDMYLYADFNITNGSNLKQGQSMKVTIDVANSSTQDFAGIYDISLYDLNGNFVERIEQKSGQTLCANCHYTNGLEFNSAKIEAEPGTYLMALLHKTTSATSWTITGSNSHLNPIKVTIKESDVVADAYENNNTKALAYSFTPSFSGNSAKIITSGSNCHLGTDYDYYKVALPTGYSYNINTRLYDLDNNDNQGTQTLDALFTYSTDGINFSKSFDYTMPELKNIEGGKTIYFKVSPYFTGDIGTYFMDVNLTRTETTSVTRAERKAFDLSPNPSRGILHYTFTGDQSGQFQIQVFDVKGAKISDLQQSFGQNSIDLTTLSNGVYVVVLNYAGKTESHRILISK